MSKSFGKNVGQLVRGWNGQKFDRAVLDLLPDKMTVDLDVLSALVKTWVAGNMYSCLIVAVYSGCSNGIDIEIFYELYKPD